MGQIKNDIKLLIKEYGGKTAARRASEKWFENGKKRANEKAVQFTSKRFFPGKIYVFRYSPIGSRELEWFDKNPVVLALDPNGPNDVGINLNLLPIDIKEGLLDKVYGQFSGEIGNHIKGGASENSIKQRHLSINWNDAKGFLQTYKFAIRQYKPGGKSVQAVVSYENWAKIVLCDFADLQGTTYNQLYRLFNKR